MQQKIYWIAGDGVGPEVMQAARMVMDLAVEQAFSSRNRLEWVEVLAGDMARQICGHPLPEESLKQLREEADVVLKGPLGTPVGSGYRSLNVALRRMFDLYACIRPVRYFQGVASPLRRPELVDMVIFRENTEDVYAGIEWPARSAEAKKLIDFLRDELQVELDPAAALGLKPMSETGSKRLVRRAIAFALDKGRSSVTLVHKGNIMKHTEGAFQGWGYAVAEQEFAGRCVREGLVPGDGAAKLVIKDRIADNMFQQALLKPQEYDVIATSNLNGDYLSDALAAQVGGLGLAPGANIGDQMAVFEPTHGTAPDIAGQDRVNPTSMILSGAMLLEHLGWAQAAERLVRAVEAVIAAGTATPDLAASTPGVREVGCRVFCDLVCEQLENPKRNIDRECV